MMLPPVQQTLESSSSLTAIVGTRIYQMFVPDGEVRPYVVWQLIAGTPESNLSDRPDMDDQRMQIDFYAANATQARQMCEAGRDAIESETNIVSGPWSTYESDTKLTRWSFDAEYWNPR